MTAEKPASSSFVERKYRAYFLPQEVALLAQQHAGKLAPARVEALRQLACGLMDKVGSRLGFPRRTVATAQVLYHRFHLFFPVKDFNFQDVSIAALIVACKLEDTLKKLRELQIAVHQVKAAQEGASTFSDPDPLILEQERSQLIAVERLILETISFNFNLRSSAAYPFRESYSTASQNQDVFAFVLKIGQHLGASKDYVKRAFRLAVDAHRTVLPLSYPPHAIAAACLYLTGFLTVSEMEGDSLYFPAGWVTELYCDMADIEEICYGVLDLLLSLSATANNAARTSPSETILPFHSPRDSSTPTFAADGDVVSAELTQIKILLRSEAARRENEEGDRAAKRIRLPRHPANLAQIDEPLDSPKAIEEGYLGRDDVTIRFLWDAPQTETANGT